MNNEKLKSLLESSEGLTDEFKASVEPIFTEALDEAVKAKEEELKGLYEEKLASKEKELEEQAEAHQAELDTLNEQVEEMVKAGVEEQVDQINEKVNSYLTYAVEEFVKSHEAELVKSESVKISESFMKDLGALYEKYNIEKPESSKALEEELAKTKEELSESYNTIYDLVNTRDELESKIEDFERFDIMASVAEEKNLSEAEFSKVQTIIEGFKGSNEEFKDKVIEIAESLVTEEAEPITENVVVSESTPVVEEVELQSAPRNAEVDAIAESLLRFNRK